MDTLRLLFLTVNKIMSMPMDVFGYQISFIQILAFVVVISVCFVFIRRLISLL